MKENMLSASFVTTVLEPVPHGTGRGAGAYTDHHLVDDQGRAVEVFNSLGNIRLELLAESAGVGVMIGSGELSPESSDNGLDHDETFAFGNNGSD